MLCANAGLNAASKAECKQWCCCVWCNAGQFAAYVNVVTEAFDLETVCKCRASGDYTQKGIPSAGTSNYLCLAAAACSFYLHY